MKGEPIYMSQHRMQCSQCGGHWFTPVNHAPEVGTYEPCPHCWSNHGSYHCPPFADKHEDQCSVCNVNVRVQAFKDIQNEKHLNN